MLKLFVSVCVLLSGVMQAAPTKPDSKSSKQLYEQAAKAIASADSRAAIASLEQLIDEQPKSVLACTAVVHLAECYVASERAQDAAALLQKWSDRIAKTSETNKLDANLHVHYFQVWLQAAKRIGDDSALLESLEKLTQTLESQTETTGKEAKAEPSSDKSQLRDLLVQARIELAKRLTVSGKLELAAVQLSHLTNLSSDASAESQLLVAMIHQQLGDHNQARKALQSLVESNPQTPSHAYASLELATYAMQDQQLDAVEKLLKPIMDSHLPNHGLDKNSDCRFRMLWSELELAHGNAARSLEVLPSDSDITSLDESQQIAIRFSRAEAAARAGKHESAFHDLDWLSEYAKKATPEPKWAVSVALRQCELLLKTKAYAKLLVAVEDAKKHFTEYERLHEFDYLLARAAIQQIDFEQARVHLKSILDSVDKHAMVAARAQWMLGETFFMEQNYGEAISAYQPATLLDGLQPWQALALMQTAKCFELLNRSDDALETYQRVVKITKDENIRQEATARIQVVERSASLAKPPSLR